MRSLVSPAFLLAFPLLLSWNPQGVTATENHVSDSAWNESYALSSSGDWISISGEADAYSALIPAGSELFVQVDHGYWEKVRPEDKPYPSDGDAGNPESLSAPDFSPVSENFSSINFSEPFRSFRFRVESKTPELLPEEIRFTFYNTRIEKSAVFTASLTTDIGGLKIISREGWGADESLRYSGPADPVNEDSKGREDQDISSTVQRVEGCNNAHLLYPDEFEIDRTVKTDNGQNLIWPLQYSHKVEKIVIHHTAHKYSDDTRDPKEVVRATYAYHARSRGWGDIGYNYLIDQNGNIYEGRAGGEFVIGGHVYCNNVQTIGISLLGNFQEEQPTKEQLLALGKLLPRLAEVYDLDLTGESKFHGETSPNLAGHRDLGPTACPGQNLYALLPDLRKLLNDSDIIQYLKSFTRTAEFTGTVRVLSLNPGASSKVSFSFKNTGNVTWGSDTWLYVVQPITGVRARSKSPTKTYVAALLKESRVKPGETGSFEAEVEAGFEGGIYSLEFTPVVDQKKLSQASVVQPVEIIPAEWGAKLLTVTTAPVKPLAGDTLSLSFAFKNTGKTKWTRESISLSMTVNRKKYTVPLKELNVVSDKEGHFVFRIDPLPESGEYPARMQFLLNGIPMSGMKTSLYRIITENPELKAELVSPKIMKTGIGTGGVSESEVRVMNTGNTSWDKGKMKLVLFGEGKKNDIDMEENVVAPNEAATFRLTFKPAKTKFYRFTFWMQNGYKKVPGVQGRWIIRTGLPTVASSPESQPQPEASVPLSIPDALRIRLGYSGEKASIMSDGTFQVYGDGKLIATVKPGIKTYYSRSGNLTHYNERNYSVIRLIPSSSENVMRISSWDRIPSWDTSGKYNDNQFRGILEFRVYDGAFVAINELPLEDYLLGIAEEPNDAPYEKQKAMAILARTYAAFYMGEDSRKYPGAPYDGDDSPASFQKYLGYGYEERSSNFTKAVRETEGMVVLYNGKLIKTPYFSQSDGRTRSAEEVWGWKDTPYLMSVDDPYCDGLTLQGHGVGLSGKGAEEAAKSGKTFEEIIFYYYQGVTLGRLGE